MAARGHDKEGKVREILMRRRPSYRTPPPTFRLHASHPSRQFLEAMLRAMITAEQTRFVDGPFPSRSDPLYYIEFRTLPSRRIGWRADTKWNARLHIRSADGRLGNTRLRVQGFEERLPFHPYELKNKCDIYQYVRWVKETFRGLDLLSEVCVSKRTE